MIPVTQSRTGAQGTCFRACIASILNLPERAVLDFDGPRRYYPDEQGLDDYWANVEGWLAERGLRYRRAPVDGVKPVGWSTIEGVSPRGGLHACVAYDGELVWDPHPIEDGTGRGLVEPRWYGLLEPIRGRVTDRADMLALRRNTERQGGPFFIQETTKGGAERTIPVREMGRAADASPARMALLLAALLAWYRARKSECGEKEYDLTRYVPKRRTFDEDAMTAVLRKLGLSKEEWNSLSERQHERLLKAASAELKRERRKGKDALSSSQLNRYPMSRLLDALGVDIREYMRRDEEQKERLLRAAIEKLDSAHEARDAKNFTVASANAALRAAGYKEKLVKGNGYYYFVDGEAHLWYSSSIPTSNLANYTADKIIRERNLLASDHRN